MPRLSPEDLAQTQALTVEYLGELGVAGTQIPGWESVANVYGLTSANPVSVRENDERFAFGALRGPQEQYYLKIRSLGQRSPSGGLVQEVSADVRARAASLARMRVSRVLNAAITRASSYGIDNPDMAWLREYPGKAPGRFVLQTVFGLSPEPEEAMDE